MTESKHGKLTDLIPDPHNANNGTQRGLKMLDTSLRKHGVGRGIVVDKNGIIIAGNKTVERAVDLGLEDAVIVQTTGETVVVNQRMDLDLTTDQRARELAYADNRVGQVDLDWNPETIIEDMEKGVNLQEFDFGGIVEGVDYNEAWRGMPEFEQNDLGAVKSIKVNFATLEDMTAFANFIGQTITEKTRYIWYPEKKNADLIGLGYKYES